MGIQFGVFQSSVSPGVNTVNVPQYPTKLVGVESAGVFAVAIITPSRQYVIPFGSAGGVVTKYVPCVLDVSGNTLNTQVIAGSGNLVWLFGTPTPEDLKYPATVYSGVYGSFSSSQTSGTATGEITLNFPSGRVKATGIAVLTSVTSTGEAVVSFTSGAGLTVYYAGYSNQVGGIHSIAALDEFEVSQTLIVNVTNYAAMTTYVIIYYK